MLANIHMDNFALFSPFFLAPRQLDFPQSPAPTAVACNNEWIVVLFEDGTIGVADEQGVRIPEFKSPVSPEKEEDTIVQIACNRTHAYMRTKAGKLYQ